VKPVPFRQSNGTLAGGPASAFGADLDVVDLPVYRDGKEIISCWRPSWRERLSILLRGRVWLLVVTPTTHPPVFLDGGHVFEED